MAVTVWTIAAAAIHLAIQVALVVRALLRPNREPASRVAWIAVILSLPVIGFIAYVLFGEVNIGRRRVQRMRHVLSGLPDISGVLATCAVKGGPDLPERVDQLFRVGRSITGFGPVGGNRARLMDSSNAAIDALVDDIDAATDHVHLLFYIWLPDNNGLKVAKALMRAAARGVACRAIADDLGSRIMTRSRHWNDMESAGVRLVRALPIGNPLLRLLRGRIDLRNHRKIVVIDNQITYCGSQNCADPEFRIKPKYAPWVDVMMRFEGPVSRQNQALFIGDWMAHADEDIGELLLESIPEPQAGFAAQVIGTGPTVRFSAMPEMFEALLHAARHEIVVTTPYFVPNESIQAALCASAHRGVETILVLPRDNDSWIVAAASRSYYEGLLEAGVRIFEYVGGLLHAKTLTVDREIALIGSANMDRRSFELNYENNILLHDPAMTRELLDRQQHFISQSRRVTPEEVASWTLRRRLRNNAIATLGPIL